MLSKTLVKEKGQHWKFPIDKLLYTLKRPYKTPDLNCETNSALSCKKALIIVARLTNAIVLTFKQKEPLAGFMTGQQIVLFEIKP